MGTYKEFLEHMSGRASVLEQKSRQLNGKLKRAITALSHDPKSAPEGPLGLDDLKSMSDMIREVRNHTLLSRMNSLVQTMIKADLELASLDVQINQDILAIHLSIIEEGSIPLAEAERLTGLFTRWQAASAAIESAHRSLSNLAERLEMAIEATDTLESSSNCGSSASSPAETAPGSKKNGASEETAPATVEIHCTVQETLELKNLLVSIMAAYIHREEFHFDLPYCCAKIAACKLARIQSPRPIKFHRKPRIKDAVRRMERRLIIYRERGEERNPDFGLFSSLVRSCRSIYQQIPEDVRKNETMNISRFAGLLESGAGLNEFLGVQPGSEVIDVSGIALSELLIRATGYDRIFMLELLEAIAGFKLSNLETVDPQSALKNETIRGSIQMLMQTTDPRLFYSSEWVATTLHRFAMDDYAILIPPMNYAHEFEYPRRNEEGHEDAFSKLAKLARLIR